MADQPTGRQRVDRADGRPQPALLRAVADEIWGPEIAAAPLYTELCELLFTSMRGVALVYAFEDRPLTTDPHLALWKRLAGRMLAVPTA